MKKFNFIYFQNENYFSSLREKSFFLKKSFSFFTVPNNRKLENYFLRNYFSPNQTLELCIKDLWGGNSLFRGTTFILLTCKCSNDIFLLFNLFMYYHITNIKLLHSFTVIFALMFVRTVGINLQQNKWSRKSLSWEIEIEITIILKMNLIVL